MKMHPNDFVAAVSIGYDVASTAFFLSQGLTLIAIANLVAGITVVLLADYYENRYYRRGSRISWLDWMQTRDLMAHGQNYEAIVLLLKKAYKMNENDIVALKPEDLKVLMQKLKVGQPEP
jgi:hypothetical protein